MDHRSPSLLSRSSSRRNGSMSSSLRSQDIIEVMHPKTGTSRIILGICRGETLTDMGKRLQLVKILSLTLLPILGLWAFTVYSLSDSIEGKSDIEQTQYAVKFSVEIGKFLDRIQRERDMSVLYLSILGPETKTFLMNEYLLTDQAVDQLSDWPENNEFSGIFRSKGTFKKFLKDHRNQLDPNNYNIYVEMDFYNFLIGRFVEWMYGAIKESNQASIWKILVAYQKIVTSMEHVGIERSLGTVFYVEGGFPNQLIYERYNNRVNNFKANYRSAVLYSHIVDPIFQEGVTATGTNLTAVIESFRLQMQISKYTNASIERGQWWFDNMTLYLDTLLIIQQDLANLINGELQNIIDAEEKNLIISACFLVIVFLMCPLVIYTVEALTSDIQKYAIALVHKTKELSKEKKKTDSLLYLMVPRPVAKSMQERKGVDAEYFKSVTILFSEILDFMQISTQLNPMEIVALLNELHTAIDAEVDNHEVYKVETINDCYMVASGLPTRIGNRHSAEVANLALNLMAMIHKGHETLRAGDRPIKLRIGINTGACMAGIVGIIMPRYCLFGDTVNTASRIKAYSMSNRIHLSASTHNSLKKHAIYIMQERGAINIKDKGKMTTYWLIGRADLDNFSPGAFDQSEEDHMLGVDNEQPGEIRPYKHTVFVNDSLSRFFSVGSSYDTDEETACRHKESNASNAVLSTIYDTATPLAQLSPRQPSDAVHFKVTAEDNDNDTGTGNDDHPRDVASRRRGHPEAETDVEVQSEDQGHVHFEKKDRLSADTRMKRQASATSEAAEAQMREEGHYEAPESGGQ
ncbi:uncharacterized protein LOC143301751 [Babylonia areolata]|uniref:uncharacterized protein LOC143301751 n=1 Tax=Babylonia areolata TaxID=304850 RepID=UPI003FD4364B